MHYQWSTRIPTVYNGYKKIAVKTTTSAWIGVSDPVVILLSIHSAFHEAEKGALNIQALISTIKGHVNGSPSIVLSEKAHLNVLTLKYNGDQAKALAVAKHDAQALATTFNEDFKDCRVLLWGDYVTRDPLYAACAQQVMALHETDQNFRELLARDAESTYTEFRAEEFPDKQAYIRSTIDDILEQCIYTLVIAKKGYRFEFYSGRQYDSIYSVNSTLLPVEEQLTHVHVNISFERK